MGTASAVYENVPSTGVDLRLMAGSEIHTGFKDGGLEEARFSDISGLCEGHLPHALLIADKNNHAVRSILDGRVFTVAGGKGCGILDGSMDEAQIAFPTSIAFLPSESIIAVTTQDSSCVRLIHTNRDSVTTIQPEHSLSGELYRILSLSATGFLRYTSFSPEALGSRFLKMTFCNQFQLIIPVTLDGIVYDPNDTIIAHHNGYLSFYCKSTRFLKINFVDHRLRPVKLTFHWSGTLPTSFTNVSLMAYCHDSRQICAIANDQFVCFELPSSGARQSTNPFSSSSFQTASSMLASSSASSSFSRRKVCRRASLGPASPSTSSHEENSPFWRPSELHEPTSTGSILVTIQSISALPYYERFSYEQIRWLNQVSPSLFPSNSALTSGGITDPNSASICLHQQPIIQQHIASDSSIWQPHTQTNRAGFCYKPPPLLLYAPSPIAQPGTGSLLLDANWSTLLLDSSPSSLADLRITNSHHCKEFLLHSGILALRGIGTHPRLTWVRNGATKSTAAPAADTTKPAAAAAASDLATEISHQSNTPSPSEEGAERLEKFKRIITSSTLPLSALNALIRVIYNAEESQSNSDDTKTVPSLFSSTFSMTECLEAYEVLMLLNNLGIDAFPSLKRWQVSCLQKASPSDHVKILYRIFCDSTPEIIERLEKDPKAHVNNMYCSIVIALLQLVGKQPEIFDSFVPTTENTSHVLPVSKLLSLSRLVYSAPSRRLAELTNETPCIWIPTFDSEWKSLSRTSNVTTPESSSRQLVNSNGSITSSSTPTSSEIDMVKAGIQFLSENGAEAGEFAIGIEGQGPKFMLAQGWILYRFWNYFEQLARANMFEMSTRVIVLPSYFSVGILERMLRSAHGHIASMRPLSQEESEFTAKLGLEFGIVVDAKSIVSEPLMASLHVLSLEPDARLSLSTCIRMLQKYYDMQDMPNYGIALSMAAADWNTVAAFGRREFKNLSPKVLSDLFAKIDEGEGFSARSPTSKRGPSGFGIPDSSMDFFRPTPESRLIAKQTRSEYATQSSLSGPSQSSFGASPSASSSSQVRFGHYLPDIPPSKSFGGSRTKVRAGSVSRSSPESGGTFGFGSSTTLSKPSGFGSSTSPSKPSGFGSSTSPSKPSGFGSSTSPSKPSSGFGSSSSPSKPSGFGSSSSPSKPSSGFGSSSSPSKPAGFGAATKPADTSLAESKPSSFAQSSVKGSTLGPGSEPSPKSS